MKRSNIIISIILIFLLVLTQGCGISEQKENNNLVNSKLLSEEKEAALDEINDTLEIIEELEGEITSDEVDELTEIIDDINRLLEDGALEDIQARKNELIDERGKILSVIVEQEEQERLEIVTQSIDTLNIHITNFEEIQELAETSEISEFNDAVTNSQNNFEEGTIEDIYTSVSVVGQTLRAIIRNNNEGKEFLQIGSGLMKNESLDFLKISMFSSEIIEKLGEPENKSEAVVWDADGCLHQTWYYDSLGIKISLSMDTDTEEELNIYSLRINGSCEYKTKRDIGIGSSRNEVINAYKNEVYATCDFDTSIVAGSIYGGMIFKIENDCVVSIFIGIGAE